MKTARIVIATVLATAIALPTVSQAQLWPWRRNGQIEQNQQQAQQIARQDAGIPATSGQANAQHQQPTLGEMKKSGLGCVAATGPDFLKHQSALKDCVVGPSTKTGNVGAYQQQIDAAKQIVAAAKTAQGTADYTTKTVKAQAPHGAIEKVSALDTLTVHFDPAHIADRDPGTTAVLTKLATLAKTSTRPVAITVHGTSKQRSWIEQQLRATDPHVQIADIAAAKPSVVLVEG